MSLTAPLEGTLEELLPILQRQPKTQRFRFEPLPAIVGNEDSADTVFYAVPLAEIEECRQLEEDWDGADAAAVSSATAELAKRLIVQIAEQTGSTTWINPSVLPDPNGHLHLLWCVNETRWLLLVNGQQTDALVRVVTPAQSHPQRKVISFEQAVQDLAAALQ